MCSRILRSEFFLLSFFCGSAAALLLPGCAHVSAKTTPAPPALDVPAPPPRDVELAEAEPPPVAAPTPQEPARRTPTPSRPRPAQPSAQQPSGPGRADAPVADRPIEEPPKAPLAGTLQTGPTGSEGELERVIRTTIARAAGDLKRVDYRGLNPDARIQYDTAKRFVQQAEDAVRLKNLGFARNLADKAAALASQLAGR
jgi:hypothetical protein